MGSILLYMSLALVLTWTVRLARAKARHPWVNPWLWGGTVLVLMLLPDPWKLFSVAPMVILLFLKVPQPQTNPGPEGITCARCLAKHPHGRYYCTSCGWELLKPYPEDMAVAGEKASAPPFVESAEPMSPAAVTAPVENLEPPPEDQSATERVPTVEETSAEAPSQAPSQAPSDEVAEAPAPVSRGVPTAASMTERGLALFDQGRVQESIDQFTKAIALDPNYLEAWEARAGAYARLGRKDEAAEDLRRLKAISAG